MVRVFLFLLLFILSCRSLKYIETTTTITKIKKDTVYCEITRDILRIDTIHQKELISVKYPVYVQKNKDIRKQTKDSFNFEILKLKVQNRKTKDSLIFERRNKRKDLKLIRFEKKEKRKINYNYLVYFLILIGLIYIKKK